MNPIRSKSFAAIFSAAGAAIALSFLGHVAHPLIVAFSFGCILELLREGVDFYTDKAKTSWLDFVSPLGGCLIAVGSFALLDLKTPDHSLSLMGLFSLGCICILCGRLALSHTNSL